MRQARRAFDWSVRGAVFLAASLLLTAQTPAPAPQTLPPTTAAPQTPAPPAPVEPSTAPRPSLGLLVLDAAHGGTDSGARGESGVVEKDVVSNIAQSLRREFERQGLRVVMTRASDASISLDDRAALANGFSNALFLSLHVASSGEPGRATAYSLAQPAAPPAPSAQNTQPPTPTPAFLVPWGDAQQKFISDSRRLAELLQVQLAQKFKGSPETPEWGAVRQLRLVAHPAVAIEISSVAVDQPQKLEHMAPGLAEAFLRAVQDYRQAAGAGSP